MKMNPLVQNLCLHYYFGEFSADAMSKLVVFQSYRSENRPLAIPAFYTIFCLNPPGGGSV